MSQTRPVHLVIGADGVVGSALLCRLRNLGEPVAGTTRRGANVGENCIYLDLAENTEGWKCPWPVDIAIICAGVTKVQACKDEPVLSARINVEGISNLASKLIAAGTFVVFLSTNQVFDGTKPHQDADGPLSPITEYGRQKAEIERRLSRHPDSAAIVRFAKVLGPQPSLFSDWASSLRSGHAIHPFSDMTLAPVPLSCAVTVLTRLASLRLPGIFQISGEEDVSYAEAAQLGAMALGADARLVQPVAAAELGTYTEPIPAHTTLNIDRLRTAMGIVPPAARYTIETAFANPQLLASI